MAYEVILPKLGQTVEESRIVEWLKEEGDPVDRGEVLFTVETDKAVLDVESTRRGYLRKILAPAGELLPVLTVVGLITRNPDDPLEEEGATSAAAPSEAVAEGAAETPASAGAPVPAEPSAPAREGRIFASPRARKTAAEHSVDIAEIAGSGPNGRIIERDVLAFVEAQPKVSPVAQRLAESLGVDLLSVEGTGPQGRIVKADVEAAAAAAEVAVPVPAVSAPVPTAPVPVAPAAPVAPAGEGYLAEVPVSGVRAIIAERMHESHQATAPVTLTMEVDATAFVALRERLKASLADQLGYNISYNDLLIMLSAKALRAFPYVNARLYDKGDGSTVIRHLDGVHVGLAIDTERGLLVPHVSDADKKGLVEIAQDVRALVERARTGRSLPDELSGSTFTITNLGMYEVDAFTPIINFPETAILGVGRIKATPAVVDGEIVVRQMLWLSLTFDHRLVDGAPAARFMQYIKQLIEEPYLLLA
ncbi:MAG: 2-oxo acid dehydrogenase subunit E2 [Anaerolineae bacterium]|nr:2-oxo acid dehydrogenase subunit E2 [Anaerolineae bacterium]